LGSLLLDRISEIYCPPEIPPHVRIGNSPDIFAHVNEPGVNLVIWQRDVPQSILDFLRFAKANEAFTPVGLELSQRVEKEMVVSFMPTARERIMWRLQHRGASFPEGIITSPRVPEVKRIKEGFAHRFVGGENLAVDALFLTQLYHRVLPDMEAVRINPFSQMTSTRTGPIKVHQDGRSGENKWRMIVTYEGPETVWTPSDNVAAYSLRRRYAVADLIDEQRVYGMGVGNVAMMKGGASGIFHDGPRSKVKVHRTGMILIPR
jgi:hypothetical protein